MAAGQSGLALAHDSLLALGGGIIRFAGGFENEIRSQPAARTPQIPAQSVSLVVTSPPFLNVVDYATDNWLRCWFFGLDAKSVKLTVPRRLDAWQAAMTEVFRELHRVLSRWGVPPQVGRRKHIPSFQWIYEREIVAFCCCCYP